MMQPQSFTPKSAPRGSLSPLESSKDQDMILKALFEYQEVNLDWKNEGEYRGMPEVELFFRSGLGAAEFRKAFDSLLLRDPRVILADVGRYQYTW